MASKRKNGGASETATAHFRHEEKRLNNPPAKIASEGNVPKVPKAVYHYSPHLPPVLRFDPSGAADKLPDLIEEAGKRALTAKEQKMLADALRAQEPWLEWAQKREQHERKLLRVDPVALHIHERVSAEAIVRLAMREDVQRDLFADPQQPYQQAVQFYKHDVDWANRLILGDSAQVMASLARRENLAGKVQMIYMDPPYGIKFASNFQPEVGKREVKEAQSDLTREPEMVRAYRDTWCLGVHSYLSYLRDRLLAARELLADSGSIFVQISDENLHRVTALLDEVFSSKSFVSLIVFSKTSGATAWGLSGTTDYILWYAKDVEQLKFRSLYRTKAAGMAGAEKYDQAELRTGERLSASAPSVAGAAESSECRLFSLDNLGSQSVGRDKGEGAACWFPVMYEGEKFLPNERNRWKTNEIGLGRLLSAERVARQGERLRYVRFLDDFPAYSVSNHWPDIGGIQSRTDPKVYVVQTSTRAVERCMLMATDPGDLVLDPTCGSGTTAQVAEQWGRRWIAVDTSRVAVSVARQRLVTAKFDHYRTRPGGSRAGSPANGFVYKTIPHITLKSIAQSANLDPIFANHGSRLEAALVACNSGLQVVLSDTRRRLKGKLADKQRSQGKRAITDADRRRWELPTDKFEHWTVPFDTDPDWPKPLADAVLAYRKTWRTKMDEVNACIERNAEQEELVDKPEVIPGVVRVSGPFTVEGVRPEELSLGEEGLFDGTPNEYETAGGDDLLLTAHEPTTPYGRTDKQNLHAYLGRMIQFLRQDGVTFLDNKRRKFARLEPLFESATGTALHGEGAWEGDESSVNDVVVAFGPQYGPVTAGQVEDLIRTAKRYSELIVAGFSFDGEACAVIQEQSHPKLRIHQAYIRPDVNPGMDGLLKDTPNSQLFSVFGQPDIDLSKTKDGWVCKLVGVDIYDPLTNTVRSTGAAKVAAWFLDSDFDGRCFCITQAFFPDRAAWDNIAAALKSRADEEAFAKLAGTESIPFEAGHHRRIAVKVIDPRGNEVMAIKSLKD